MFRDRPQPAEVPRVPLYPHQERRRAHPLSCLLPLLLFPPVRESLKPASVQDAKYSFKFSDTGNTTEPTTLVGLHTDIVS